MQFETFSILLLLLLQHLQTIAHNNIPMSIKVGAVFSSEQDSVEQQLLESSFKYTLNSLNRDKSILPDIELLYDTSYVQNSDTFHANRKVCEQIKSGVQAIFGPTNQHLGANIHSICDALDIPHLIMRNDDDAMTMHKSYSINLHPKQSYLNAAIFDVIAYLNWTKVGILHEQHFGVLSVRQLMLMKSFEVFVRLVQPRLYASVLLEFKMKDINNIIIDTNAHQLPALLKKILHFQMNEYKYHYFFTSFDIDTFDLDDFKYNYVNITAFRLVSVGDPRVKEILKDMLTFHKRHTIKKIAHMNKTTEFRKNWWHRELPIALNETRKNSKRNSNEFHMIETEQALMYDAVHIFALGLQALKQSHKLQLKNISCEAEEPWDGGLSLINYMNTIEWKGLTGPLQFKDGHRIQFKLDLVKLLKHNIFKVGEWSPLTRLNITTPALLFETDKMNLTLVVITILESPYVMMHYSKNYTGNERFYGFCVDLLEMIAHKLGFGYILDLVPDRKYGAKDPKTGEWNGMVEQLMKNKADLAVGSMTITYARESVIDFTKPFMNLGIGILLKVPGATPKHLFSFMNPLAFEVWLCVFAAYFLVSFTLYMLVRCTGTNTKTIMRPPTRTNTLKRVNSRSSGAAAATANVNINPKGTITKTMATTRKLPKTNSIGIAEIRSPATELSVTSMGTSSNQMKITLATTFWFTIGTLMQQTTELNPQTISTRIVSGIWWFFTLIIISSYTANLAAFLTVERMITPIENAEDLASQTEILYGTLESGSTMAFFRDSLIETYRKMWRNMDNKKTNVFTTTYEEGIERVNQGNYAFLMESTMIDYIVQRNCNLTQIGGLLDAKGYGIATPKGSPWRDRISLAILQLQEKGDVQLLYDKWWKQKRDNCIRKNEQKHTKANALSLETIGGIFVVLILGIIIAIFVSIAEFWQNYKQRKLQQKKLFEKIAKLNYVAATYDIDVNNDNQQQQQQYAVQMTPPPPMRSLWSEMATEFCYAVRCYKSNVNIKK